MLTPTTSPIARTGVQAVIAYVVAQVVLLASLDLSADRQAALVGLLTVVVSGVWNLYESRTGRKFLGAVNYDFSDQGH